MTLEARFAPNSPEILTGMVEGDALLINLATGTYYSMANVAGYIWAQIEKRHSIKEMLDSLVQRYDISLESARRDLQTFLQKLEHEHLVLAASVTAATDMEVMSSAAGNQPYESPELERIEQPDWGTLAS